MSEIIRIQLENAIVIAAKAPFRTVAWRKTLSLSNFGLTKWKGVNTVATVCKIQFFRSEIIKERNVKEKWEGKDVRRFN